MMAPVTIIKRRATCAEMTEMTLYENVNICWRTGTGRITAKSYGDLCNIVDV